VQLPINAVSGMHLEADIRQAEQVIDCHWDLA